MSKIGDSILHRSIHWSPLILALLRIQEKLATRWVRPVSVSRSKNGKDNKCVSWCKSMIMLNIYPNWSKTTTRFFWFEVLSFFCGSDMWEGNLSIMTHISSDLTWSEDFSSTLDLWSGLMTSKKHTYLKRNTSNNHLAETERGQQTRGRWLMYANHIKMC